MYITADLRPYLSSSVVVFGSELCMSTKCNALAVKSVISAVIPTHRMSAFFPFLTFSIISLHFIARRTALFCENSTVGPLRTAISGRLDKKHEQIWSKPGSIWSDVSSRESRCRGPGGAVCFSCR
jgi:hypothetical protein